MIKVKKVFEKEGELNFILKRDFEIEKNLFSPEVHISIAYCESLFEAGILNRLETEKVKNGLQTILKRAEFDKTYFDQTNSKNIQEFIEEKLFSLVGEVGIKIQLGRSFNERNSTALRLWLRRRIVNLSQTIREIQQFFVNLADKHKDSVFYTNISDKNPNPILFAHWCLAKFEMFQRNRERLDEVWRRVNTMPIGADKGIGASLEFDREDLAKKLGFQRISTNSLDSVTDFDFILEFINVISIISVQLSSFIDELNQVIKTNLLKAESNLFQKNLTLIKGKLQRIFAFQSELNSNLQSLLLKNNKDFSGNNEVLFRATEVFTNCLEAFNFMIQSLSINETLLNEKLSNFHPNSREIFDYLIQRNESNKNAKEISEQIEKFLLENKFSEDILLTDLQKFSDKVENDFFDELSLEAILNTKNQIGGTSRERVFEALEEVKKDLQYEE